MLVKVGTELLVNQKANEMYNHIIKLTLTILITYSNMLPQNIAIKNIRIFSAFKKVSEEVKPRSLNTNSDPKKLVAARPTKYISQMIAFYSSRG